MGGVSLKLIVPGTGLEPVRPQWSRDFKSLVSTNSTIWAALSGCKDSVKSEKRKMKSEKFSEKAQKMSLICYLPQEYCLHN